MQGQTAHRKTIRRGREASPDGEPTHDPIGPRATSGRRAREVQAGASPAARGLHRAQRGGTRLFRGLVGSGRAGDGPGPHTLVLHSDDRDLSCISHGRPWRTSNWVQVSVLADRERSEEHTSELQSPCNLVCRLLLEKKKKIK